MKHSEHAANFIIVIIIIIIIRSLILIVPGETIFCSLRDFLMHGTLSFFDRRRVEK